MKNAFDGLIALLGIFFVIFTAMLDKGATIKVAAVAIAVFVGYKLFFAAQVEEEHIKYHAKKSVPTKKVVAKKMVVKKDKKKSSKRKK